ANHRIPSVEVRLAPLPQQGREDTTYIVDMAGNTAEILDRLREASEDCHRYRRLEVRSFPVVAWHALPSLLEELPNVREVALADWGQDEALLDFLKTLGDVRSTAKIFFEDGSQVQISDLRRVEDTVEEMDCPRSSPNLGLDSDFLAVLSDRRLGLAGDGDDEVIIPPLLLRMKVAKSVRDYEAMRDADSPPPEARDRVAENIRQHNSSVGVHLILSTWWLSLDEALVNGAPSMPSKGWFRVRSRSVAWKRVGSNEDSGKVPAEALLQTKQAADDVQRLKKQQKEESDAAARIQAKYRGRQANKQVQEMREQKQEQEAASATKIQARFRQKQAASEVEGMRQQKHAQACSNREQSRTQRLDEFRQRISVKVDVVLEANGRAVVNVQLAAKDGVSGTSHNEIDIPVNDETAQAATKIQAKFRQKQAAGEVDAKRKEKEQMHSEADNEIDIPVDDETAQAATKIQAKFRQKQAASEVEAMRKEKLKSESGDGAAEAEPLDADRFETDVDIVQAELARPADEISEVEAMLKEKEKEQQQLVEDNSPKVEGMFGSKQEKRPMAVSPAIPEGDEEE
ncbi:unnamed protein product, partial [Symbiodinium sp. KB8]